MQEALALLSAHLSVGITENETNRRKEITLAGTIAADDNIGFGRERLNNGLVLVAAIDSLECARRTARTLDGTYLLKP